MTTYFDIDLIFEIRYLQLNIARKERFIDSSTLQYLYYKPFISDSTYISLSPILAKSLSRTIKFKLEGYYLINSLGNDNFGFLSEIENEYYSVFASEYFTQSISQITHNGLLNKQPSEIRKVYSSQEEYVKKCIDNGIEAEYIPLSGQLSFEYLQENIPWDTYSDIDSLKLVNGEVKITGQIVTGFGRGSSQLGFPTANIQTNEKLELVPGVYATRVKMEGNYYKGAISIGWCPYYENRELSYEVYILGKFSSTLVGKIIECEILYYIRCESNFRKLDDLIKAISLDVSLTDRLITLPN
ncbi:hypothetical protein SteCoe_11516 [Stentor coeruleus]|uniref:riboflavin kinase n=1 Tax=Stentor coeruleus TaxID=5963 RepID=A0A1R2CD38_9CILI|nr:hypothetical protein SteCoe_11516 [Stentor coeruleus]